LYVQLGAVLQHAIESGAVAPGERVSSESKLAVHYGVSRETARRALDVLSRAGLVEKRRGSGTYVRAERRHALPRTITLPTQITVPQDMPPGVVAMLQATLADAWNDFEGDRNDPAAFWSYLMHGEGE
jgi:DNA-binding GntR family transcriptional regulator